MSGGTSAPPARPLGEALSGVTPPVSAPVYDQLVRLYEMLHAWKGAGIVGFRTPEDLARYYFREALLLQPLLPAPGPFLDIGSGGGTPALPLALAGDAHWTLLEPRRASGAFLDAAIESLGLAPRVRVNRQRLKDFLKSDAGRTETARFAGVTLRAVKLRAEEWSLLAGSLSPDVPVIWPTSRSARQRAELEQGLFEEEFVTAERGVVWIGRAGRDAVRPTGVSRETPGAA